MIDGDSDLVDIIGWLERTRKDAAQTPTFMQRFATRLNRLHAIGTP
jgi:hypothetical protein